VQQHAYVILLPGRERRRDGCRAMWVTLIAGIELEVHDAGYAADGDVGLVEEDVADYGEGGEDGAGVDEQKRADVEALRGLGDCVAERLDRGVLCQGGIVLVSDHGGLIGGMASNFGRI
jgi:hypothetical protein